MRKLQAVRVQLQARRKRFGAVECVAEDGIAQLQHMQAELVCAAAVRYQFDQARLSISRNNPVIGRPQFAVDPIDFVFRAIGPVAEHW